MVLFSLFDLGKELIFKHISTYFPALSSSLLVGRGRSGGDSLVGFTHVPFSLSGDRVQGMAHMLNFFLLCLLHSPFPDLRREVVGSLVGQVLPFPKSLPM
jgi:hypothetical protein